LFLTYEFYLLLFVISQLLHQIHFSRLTFSQALKNTKVFYWGDTYGRGDPIRMDLVTYLGHLSQRSIPSNVKTFPLSEKNFSTQNTQAHRGLEYYWVKPHSKTKEYDWQGLVLILERHHGQWYLVGLMRDRWTI